MTTDTEVKYQCTKCYHYFPAGSFDADNLNKHRNFLKCWCKRCTKEKARETKIQKRIEEQERKAKIAKELALSHPLVQGYQYRNGYLFLAEDLGDIGVALRLANPSEPLEISSIILPPLEVCVLEKWLRKSNEGKKGGE